MRSSYAEQSWFMADSEVSRTRVPKGYGWTDVTDRPTSLWSRCHNNVASNRISWRSPSCVDPSHRTRIVWDSLKPMSRVISERHLHWWLSAIKWIQESDSAIERRKRNPRTRWYMKNDKNFENWSRIDGRSKTTLEFRRGHVRIDALLENLKEVPRLQAHFLFFFSPFLSTGVLTLTVRGVLPQPVAVDRVND